MQERETEIRETIVRTAVQNWQDGSNPFSDIVFKDGLVDDVLQRLDSDVDRNDVEYVWKLMVEEGYFRKRGSARRITAKEIDEAAELGVDTKLDSQLQDDILEILKEAERNDVNNPEVEREELLGQLDADPEAVDYNVFYCNSKGWIDVKTFIEESPWRWAEITRLGRNKV